MEDLHMRTHAYTHTYTHIRTQSHTHPRMHAHACAHKYSPTHTRLPNCSQACTHNKHTNEVIYLLHYDHTWMACSHGHTIYGKTLKKKKFLQLKCKNGHCGNICGSQYTCRLWACMLILKV